MRTALKALGALLAIVVLCAPLMFLPEEDTQLAAGVTVTVPPMVVVATTIPGVASTTTTTERPVTPPPTTAPTIPTTTTTAPIEVTIAAAGDLFAPPQLLESVRDPETGSYDFTPVLDPISPYLRNADYAVLGLQPRLAGPEAGYGSETVPNAPRELAFALRAAGIDLVGTANRHSLDLGWGGVTGTLDRLDDAGLAHVGTSRSASERNTPVIADIKGIRVAFLNYTKAVDTELPPDQKNDFAVNVLDAATVREDAVAARSWGAEVVVAMIDLNAADAAQMDTGEVTGAGETTVPADIADLCDEAPVDVILGYQEHAIQSIIHRVSYVSHASWRAGDRYVAYSLGDFLHPDETTLDGASDLTDTTSTTTDGASTTTSTAPAGTSTTILDPDTNTGMILYLHLKKEGLITKVTGVSYLPLYLQTATVEAGGGATPSGTTTTGYTTASVGATTTTAAVTATTGTTTVPTGSTTTTSAATTTTTGEGGSAIGPVTVFRILPVLPGLPSVGDLPLSDEDISQMTRIWEYVRNLLYRPNESMTPLSPGDLGL